MSPIPLAVTAAAAGVGTVGSIIQAGVSLANKPTYPGASAEEEQALFFAGETAADASMLGEASAGQVSRMVQAGNQVDAQQTQEFNAMFRNVSPFDMAKISQSLMKRSLDVRKQTEEGIASFLDSSQAKNLLTRVSANKGFADIANTVQQKKLQAQLLKEATEEKMNKQFTDMMTNITKAISSPILDIGGGSDFAPGISMTQPNASQQQVRQNDNMDSVFPADMDLRQQLIDEGLDPAQVDAALIRMNRMASKPPSF